MGDKIFELKTERGLLGSWATAQEPLIRKKSKKAGKVNTDGGLHDSHHLLLQKTSLNLTDSILKLLMTH